MLSWPQKRVSRSVSLFTSYVDLIAAFCAILLPVSALLNVTSLYHDTLLSRAIKSDPKLRPLVSPSLHTRYTHAWCEKNSTYKWAARTLEIIKFVQLLLEMGLRRTVSSNARWRGIVLLEMIKYVLIEPTFAVC